MDEIEATLHKELQQVFVTIRREMMDHAQKLIDNALSPYISSDAFVIDASALPFSDDDPENISLTAADPGVGETIPRVDHVHKLDTTLIDHGTLTGLLDDDHTQYQKESEKGAANGYASLDASSLVPDAQIPSSIARDSEVSSAISTHAGLSDPHTGYQKESEKGTANGYASLGSDSLVPQDQLGTGVQDGTKFLRDDGTWQTATGISGGQYRQFVWFNPGPTFEFVTDIDGNPIFSLEDLE